MMVGKWRVGRMLCGHSQGVRANRLSPRAAQSTLAHLSTLRRSPPQTSNFK
eukprot:UN01936